LHQILDTAAQPVSYAVHWQQSQQTAAAVALAVQAVKLQLLPQLLQ
jgi:hypothetical protein